MSLAEEMLATMPLSDDSETYSADEEPHIVINESRQAIVPNELRTIAVTGDKDIETITFDCVRYWDGNDLSTFAIYLNYVLPDLTTGTYIPEKITTTDGDEFYHFDWQIKNNITVKSGKISFAVTAISTTTNWAGNPIVDKQWSSLPNSDCYIALGIDVSNVPSEEESSAVLAQMSAILEQIQTDFNDWLKNSVVQTTGDSTTAVMSQRATTEEFDLLKNRLKLYDSAYGIIATGLENTYYIAMRNSKQIDNLKSGISDQFETDSSVAYVKDVPPNALPYAEVKKIGGMTYKSKNLWDEQWEVGQLDVNSGNELSGTTRIRSKNYIPLDGEVEYHFSYDSNSNVFCCYDANYTFIGTKYQWNKKFTTLPNTKYVKFMLNPDYGNQYKNDIMINQGPTALPYEPYFEGLRSAKVTEVKSVGVNLLDESVLLKSPNITFSDTEYIIQAGVYEIDTGINYKPNTRYTLAYTGKNDSGAVRLELYYTDGTKSEFYFLSTEYKNLVFTTAENKTVKGLYCHYGAGGHLYIKKGTIMIYEGADTKPYTPYVEHTLPIPEAVRPANGINENVYDFIEWAEDGSVKKTVKCGVVDLGTLDWQYVTSGNKRFDSYSLIGVLKKISSTSVSNIICTKYEKVGTANQVYSGLAQIATTDGVIWICDTNYTDPATFKAAMSGVMLVYELAEPIVTDISDLITADNLIGVEGGGTLTFENEYGYAVPSEVEYQVEV